MSTRAWKTGAAQPKRTLPITKKPKPPPRSTKTPLKTRAPKPTPPDPLIGEIDAQFKPAYDALERQRLVAKADRDASLRDRAAFDDWARTDRERRLGVLQSDLAATAGGLAEQRRLSDERITSAIDSALGRLGGLGQGALSSAGFTDATAGAKTGMDVASVLAAREGARGSAMVERADAQSRIDRANSENLASRALAQYGRRQTALDEARFGLDQKKSDVFGKAKSDRETQRAKAAEDAWMRTYLTGKQSDSFNLGKARVEATVRGQDVAADTAAQNRASSERIAAARIEAQLTKAATQGYRGLDADQYTKLRSDWYKRAVDALDPAKFEGDLTKVRATGTRQLDVLVGAGLRPRDAAAVVESATGGSVLAESDYLAFFRRHLPSANAHRLMYELFGVPVPTGTGSFSSQSGATNTQPRKKLKAPARKGRGSSKKSAPVTTPFPGALKFPGLPAPGQ